jgi:hypothetical protein
MAVCATTPDIRAWAAHVGGTVAAYAITLMVEKDGIIQSTMSDPSALGAYPNNALIFTVTRALLAEGASAVHYGFASEDAALVRFKENMGFKRQRLPCRAIFNPLLLPILRRIKKFRHYFPTDLS